MRTSTARLSTVISSHRRARWAVTARRCAEFYRRAHENLNYDHTCNGEEWLLHKLRLPPDAVIFDVGANVGTWTMLARTAAPGAQIHAFELIPHTAQTLRANVGQHPNVVINDFGLADKDGSVAVSHYPTAATRSSLYEYPVGAPSVTVHAQVKTGANYMDSRGLKHVDLLKIDTEGADHLVLAGFGEQLTDVDVIQFEYGKASLVTRYLLADYYDVLTGRGFAVGKLYPNHVHFRDYSYADEDFLGPNYVAVRETRGDIMRSLS